MKIYVTSDYNVVKVCGKYPDEVSKAYAFLSKIKQTRTGTTWGLEGVAEYVARKRGFFCINKSGVSKREAKKLVKTGKAILIP